RRKMRRWSSSASLLCPLVVCVSEPEPNPSHSPCARPRPRRARRRCTTGMDDLTEQTDWERFTNARFAVEFSYPSPTPQGYGVEVIEERAHDHRGDMERVHLSSESAELYLEVARFVGITPQDE